MRFSAAFKITRTKADDWFDPHLTIDTKLFVDPLLLALGGKKWHDSHDELIEHFVHCYRFVAKADSPNSVSGKAARRMLTFPEPAEFGLGYTAGGTAGAGSGSRFAHQMADGIAVAIAKGLDRPEHIEEIGILNVGIGADRISDAACNVLKHRFIKYTQQVAKRHGLQMEPHKVRHTRVMVEQARWLDDEVLLPTNPITGGAIILVPDKILNKLPVLNADDWFDSNMNDDIRSQMNLTMGQRVTKSDIVAWARRYPKRVRAWARDQSTRMDLKGYDFGDDPKGVVGWDKKPVDYAKSHPITGVAAPTNQAELSVLVENMLKQFRHFIEDQRGWSLLLNADRSEKPEEAAQLLFLGMAQHYLRLFNVEVDREVELGRGPVDFKVSSGSKIRLLIEVKKAHNGTFWNGVKAQLPSYLKSDDCNEGWFVAIRYRSNKASQTRMNELPAVVRTCARSTGKNLRYLAIDGRHKESASNEKPEN